MDIRGRLSTPKGTLRETAHRTAEPPSRRRGRAPDGPYAGASRKWDGSLIIGCSWHATVLAAPARAAPGAAHASGAAHPGQAPSRAPLWRPCGGGRARQSEPPLPSSDRDAGGRGVARRARRRARAAPCRARPAGCTADRLSAGCRRPVAGWRRAPGHRAGDGAAAGGRSGVGLPRAGAGRGSREDRGRARPGDGSAQCRRDPALGGGLCGGCRRRSGPPFAAGRRRARQGRLRRAGDGAACPRRQHRARPYRAEGAGLLVSRSPIRTRPSRSRRSA